MVDIHSLLNQIAQQEHHVTDQPFLAPCLAGGSVCTRLKGLVYTFRVEPADFAGWGILQAVNAQVARWVAEPTLMQISEYLKLWRPLRLWLVKPLSGSAWLGYPVNAGDMRQRWGWVKPLPVHLVEGGGQFEGIVARWDGKTCWFAEADRRADPQISQQLQAHYRRFTPPQQLAFPGLTPEMRAAYQLASQGSQGFVKHQPPEDRLAAALRMGGGQLQHYRDQGDYWQVSWLTADGEPHMSAIDPQDLTVISAGICLSGRDQDFDLTSLVGVMEGKNE
ncbi:MAG: hypothetical protein NW237_06895 [Cyanobacteriota bacterium]|nr:hypothetical protein [Cyanobacteriota bacterium]